MPETRVNANGQIEVKHPSGGWVLTTSPVPPPDGMISQLNPTQFNILQSILSVLQNLVITIPPIVAPIINRPFRSPYIESPLTAPGVTPERDAGFSKDITFQITVTGLSSGDSVVVRPEGTLDYAEWFTLADDTTDTLTYSVNKTYGVVWRGILTAFRLTAITIPTGASVQVSILVGGNNNG